MKKFDLKSALVGFLIGTIGLTTAFAAGGIQSAEYSATKVTLDGTELALKNPLVAITKDGEKNASMYMPVRELLERLGYTVTWDGASDTVALDSGAVSTAVPKSEDTFFRVKSSSGRVVSSGYFDAVDGQSLTLTFTMGLKDSKIDFFLFDPSGKEQHIVIDANTKNQKITLSTGRWAYNCSGALSDGESITIEGAIGQ